MSENVKRVYEALYLVDSTLATSNWDEVVDTIQIIMNRANAEVINLRKWDDRRLCYEIKGCRRGTYILSYFKADPVMISMIERDIRLNELLLRVMILRADFLSENEEEAATQMNAATPAETGGSKYHDDEEGFSDDAPRRRRVEAVEDDNREDDDAVAVSADDSDDDDSADSDKD